ncbi:MAG: zinc ribbon domain-containing protein [Planctomycetota bacterium]|jgi:predicted  nucleic acid-binding Zn-ribbon protein
MTVTEKLLRLHQVDAQLRGLQHRIDSAQRYLNQQEIQLTSLAEQRDAVEAQLRQLKASLHNDETEIAQYDEKIAKLRDQLNNAQTSKEYSTFLSEINTFKADKAQIEERTLEHMSQIEELEASLAKVGESHEQRVSIRDVAQKELKQRQSDASERIEELKKEREVAAADVPGHALNVFDEIADRFDHDEPVMAALDEHSRRSMEYACSSCQTMVPVELVSRLLGKGDLTICVSCGAILYLDSSLKESMLAKK